MNELQAIMTTLNAAISQLDIDHAKVVAQIVSSTSHVDCTRCDKPGSGTFTWGFGNDERTGVCFRCGGTGKVPARGKKAGMERATNAAEIDRLRELWKITKRALRTAEELPEVEDRRADRKRRWLVKSLQQDLVRIERNGKAMKGEQNA